MTPLETRLATLRNGFTPTPCAGKAAVAKGWQTKIKTNAEEIQLWDRLYPTASNTGVLCQLTPALDIDVTLQPAAEAVEQLARDEFEERGSILVRFGKPPKRAILLRTDEPFDKISASFSAPDGSQHRIEVLGNGQQIIVEGIHPDTSKPYTWHGGSPLTTRREDLPYTRRDDAAAFLIKATNLLVNEFGFIPIGLAQKANGIDRSDADRTDWAVLVANIIAGRDLHDSATRLAAAYVASGMDASAAARAIEALFLTSATPRDERWKARFADVRRAVRTACEKFGQDAGAIDRPLQANFWSWQFYGRQETAIVRPYLIDKLLPETGVGLISGQWGTYKTFAALDLGAAVITSTEFAGFPVARRGAVLLIAVEGEGEVDVRMRAALAHRGHAEALAPFAWINSCPRLLDQDAGRQLAEMVKQAAEKMMQEFGKPVVLVIIDTAGKAAGYSKAGDENDATLARQVVGALSAASRETGALFLGVDHFGKAAETGTRGSSAKEADCDVVLALLGEKNVAGEVANPRLAIRKRRSGANGVEIPFRPKVVQADENETTLVVDWLQPDQAVPTTKADAWPKSLRLLRQTLMNVLVDNGTEQRPFIDGPMVRAVDIEIVRREFYATHPAEGTDKQKSAARRQAFNRAVQAAQNSGVIGVRDIGAVTFVWLAKPEV